MSTYLTMQNRLASDLSRDNLTSEIKDAIQSAIAFYENESFFFNQARATDTTVNGTEYYDVPTDFLKHVSMTVTVNSTKYIMEPKTWDWFENVSTSTTYTGYPHYYAIFSKQYRIYPIPDAAYTLNQAYIKSLSTLSDGGDTNAWMTDGYELILARAGKIISLNKIRDDQRAGNYAALEAESYRKLKMRNAGYSASKVRSTEF